MVGAGEVWRLAAGAAALGWTLVMSGQAMAQADVSSANYVMPGCRSFTASQATQDAFRQGFCIGLVEGLVIADDRICAPDTLTTGQFVRTVIRYIDARPRRRHEPFATLATEAMRVTFPCR